MNGAKLYAISSIIIQRERSRLERLMSENPWLDGMILNTAEHNFGEVISAVKPGSVGPFNIVVQRPTGPLIPDVRVRYGNSFHIPRPEQAIFKDRRYCFPQSKRSPVTCVQFSFGCPFACEFCIDNQLYRKTLYRNVDDVIEELVEIDRLGFREVYFKDLTFGLDKSTCTEFLEKLIARRLRLRWLFADCRRLGIETTAFILLAMEDDTADDVRATIRFAHSLHPDYVSFNVLNALPGTALEVRARREGFLREGPSDYRFVTTNIKHRHLTPRQVEKLRCEANRSFYGRRGLIIERLLKLRSFGEFRKLVRLGWYTMLGPPQCT